MTKIFIVLTNDKITILCKSFRRLCANPQNKWILFLVSEVKKNLQYGNEIVEAQTTTKTANQFILKSNKAFRMLDFVFCITSIEIYSLNPLVVPVIATDSSQNANNFHCFEDKKRGEAIHFSYNKGINVIKTLLNHLTNIIVLSNWNIRIIMLKVLFCRSIVMIHDSIEMPFRFKSALIHF